MQEYNKSECNARVAAYQKALHISQEENFDIERAKERTRQFKSSIEIQNQYYRLKQELYEILPAPPFVSNYVQRLQTAVKVHAKEPLSVEAYRLLIDSINSRLKVLHLKEDFYSAEISKIEMFKKLLQMQLKNAHETDAQKPAGSR